jgi:hypothetical protein
MRNYAALGLKSTSTVTPSRLGSHHAENMYYRRVRVRGLLLNSKNSELNEQTDGDQQNQEYDSAATDADRPVIPPRTGTGDSAQGGYA